MKQYLCSHLVSMNWKGRSASANLEKIWSAGATLSAEECLEPGDAVTVECPDFFLDARVTACSSEPDGWLIDLEFRDGYTWSPELFEPDHFTDPDILLVRKLLSELLP